MGDLYDELQLAVGAAITREYGGIPLGIDEAVTDALLPIVEGYMAEAWEAGEDAGRHNEHEFRPGRQLTNPYPLPEVENECPYTQQHTKYWCGYEGCRES